MNALTPFAPPQHGAWIQTASGYCIDLHAPDLRSVRLTEIAASLSRIPRFIGHTRGTYAMSVAQHCCHVADFLFDQSIQVQRAGLLHDAHEAFIGDLATPVKQLLGAELVREAERPLVVALHERFGVSPELIAAPIIKEVDLLMMAAERRDLMAPSAWPWGLKLPDPAGVPEIDPWPASEAEAGFLYRAERLGLIR